MEYWIIIPVQAAMTSSLLSTTPVGQSSEIRSLTTSSFLWRAPTLSAIGDNINIAARLEAKTKVFKCNIIVSSDTVRHAGLIPDPTMEHKVAVRGRKGEITVLALDSVNDIPGFHQLNRLKIV